MICFGVNDDGFGVVGVFEFVCIFVVVLWIECSLVFVLWSGEECGLLGLEIYVVNLVYFVVKMVVNLMFDIF